MMAGKQSNYWNGKSKIGNDLSSGVYLYQLNSYKFSKTYKMILLK